MDSPLVDVYYARPMGFWIKFGQVAIACAVGGSAIYFQQNTGYKLNPFIVAAWSFMAAYGATLLVVKLADWHRNRRLRLD